LLTFLAIESCAPHRLAPPRIELDERRARFLGALAARESRGASAELDVSAWVRASDWRDLPGVRARLLVSAPDAFRIRVESTFGTALDLSARGDTLVAYVPHDRLGMELDSAADSLGIADPGILGFRLWTARWHPPDEAWNRAEIADSVLVMRW